MCYLKVINIIILNNHHNYHQHHHSAVPPAFIFRLVVDKAKYIKASYFGPEGLGAAEGGGAQTLMKCRGYCSSSSTLYASNSVRMFSWVLWSNSRVKALRPWQHQLLYLQLCSWLYSSLPLEGLVLASFLGNDHVSYLSIQVGDLIRWVSSLKMCRTPILMIVQNPRVQKWCALTELTDMR